MRLEVRRKRARETRLSVGGELWVDGQLECYTIEPARKDPFHEGHPCVEGGRFRVELTLSPHFHYVTPELLEVPGRTHIRVHRANSYRDLLGCVGVGTGHSTDWVSQSEVAFERLMVLLKTSTDGLELEFVEEAV